LNTGSNSERVRVLIGGRVQGVGFRYAAQRAANRLGLTGWVRNLPDGRVEALLEGSPESVETMTDWCRKGPAFSRVLKVEVVPEAGPCQYSDFRITG
jgi:acylphosphatase